MANAEKNLACLVLKCLREDIREYSLIRKPRINYFFDRSFLHNNFNLKAELFPVERGVANALLAEADDRRLARSANVGTSRFFSNRVLCCDFITLYKSIKNAAERHLMHHIWISISKVTAFQTLHFE